MFDKSTNVKGEIKDGELILRIKLNERHGPSSSGKTTIVASTHGAEDVIADNALVRVNVNVYTKGK